MFREVINQVSVFTTLDTRRAKSDGLYPVRVQVYCQGKQKYYNTGKELTKEVWDRLPSTRVAELIQIRNTIKGSFDLIVRTIKELVFEGTFTFYNLEVRMGKTSAGSLIDGFKLKMEILEQEERIGTLNYYRTTAKNIEQFAGPVIPFENVTVDWLKKYEKWLVDTGKNLTTIGMYMRGIRSVLNTAKREGMIRNNQYPFGIGKYEIRTTVSIKRALPITQIVAIANYQEGTLSVDRYRDLWIFIYLCNGINVSDLVNLKFENIIDDEICFIRQKTKRTSRKIQEIRAILTPEMKQIIQRWGNEPKPENPIFPLIRHYDDPVIHHREVGYFLRSFNRKLKEIGQALGIDNLTTYTARHCYATTLKRNGVNIAFISEQLGHTSITTTKAYLDSFEKEERIKNAEILSKSLHQ